MCLYYFPLCHHLVFSSFFLLPFIAALSFCIALSSIRGQYFAQKRRFLKEKRCSLKNFPGALPPRSPLSCPGVMHPPKILRLEPPLHISLALPSHYSLSENFYGNCPTNHLAETRLKEEFSFYRLKLQSIEYYLCLTGCSICIKRIDLSRISFGFMQWFLQYG